MAPRYQCTVIPLKNTSIRVYASPKISDALGDLAKDMSLYQGVRFGQILEAVYVQGSKDGARIAFEARTGNSSKRKNRPHRTPGRPKKKK